MEYELMEHDLMKHELMNPVTLTGSHVALEPLLIEHKGALLKAASDGELWQLWFTGVPSAQTIDDYLQTALEQQRNNTALPFVVRHLASNSIIGCTRFCNASEQNRRIEIGYTWYAKSYQRSAVNTECKLLLLRHAFEQLNRIAVEFRTHWMNHASRNAIARLGAKQDAILRKFIVAEDGSTADKVVFSILDEEWPMVKQHLQFKLTQSSSPSSSTR